VTGCIVSLPEGRQPLLNRLYLRAAAWSAGREDEVVLNETVRRGARLRPGDASPPSSTGGGARCAWWASRCRRHLMQMQPGIDVPGSGAFGVLWMGRDGAGRGVRHGGRVQRGRLHAGAGREHRRRARAVDLLLGGTAARRVRPRRSPVARADHRGVPQLRGMATMLPAIFLAVAAFLLNIVVTRLIACSASRSRC
jgi:putative ABC transport system permease protein